MGRIADLIDIKDGDYLPCFCSGCGRSIKYHGESSIVWTVTSTPRRIVVSHSGCRLDFQSKHFYDIPYTGSSATPKRFGPVRKRKGGAKISPGVAPEPVPDMPIETWPEPKVPGKSFTAPMTGETI